MSSINIGNRPSIRMGSDIIIGNRPGVALGGGGGLTFLLRDLFTTDRAAGAVNGTPAEPGGSLGESRGVTDLDSRITISGGKAVFAAGGSDGDRTALWYNKALTRTPGLVMAFDFTYTTSGTKNSHIGPATATGAGQTQHLWTGLRILGAYITVLPSSVADAARVHALAQNTTYRAYFVHRATGRFVFIKSGGTVRHVWTDDWDSTVSLYAVFNVNSSAAAANYDNMAVLGNQFYQVLTTSSDSFNRDDGTPGSTDGLGHAEGNSGDGVAWVSSVGTATISSNKLALSTLSGGVGIATVDLSDANQDVEVEVTRSGGNVGLVGRYADASNYVYAHHDGTNITLRQIVAGSDSQLIAPAAATYAAGARMKLHFDGTECWLYYNKKFIGSAPVSIHASLTGTRFGVYSTNTANTFDNWFSLARRGYADLGAY